MSKETLLQKKVWAVVGATNNVEKFGYKIFKFMQDYGLEVYPVNPGITDINGIKCYPSLKDLPKKPEAVDVVVPSRVGEQVVRDCAELGINNVWLQPGADADNVINAAKQLGLNVVYNSCVMVELKKQGG